MYSKEAFLEGKVLLIDKPLGWTSFQVVNKVRWLIRQNRQIKKIKVGHAGTLDPLASGLLIICTGKMTKQINTYQGMPKEYTGTFEIGGTTPSYDKETEVHETFPTDHILEKTMRETTHLFMGEIEQTPPLFSAIKKDGERLYELARKGETTDIPTRMIRIDLFDIQTERFPLVDFVVQCSKGTYIRSLAHDFGKALQSGAHLAALRRTKIGGFSVENAISLDDFEKQIKSV